jgi:hypothetical protein
MHIRRILPTRQPHKPRRNSMTSWRHHPLHATFPRRSSRPRFLIRGRLIRVPFGIFVHKRDVVGGGGGVGFGGGGVC